MAKKKTETHHAPSHKAAAPKASGTKAATHKPATKRSPAKKGTKAPAPIGGTPLVDTSFAAEAAARMLTARAKLKTSAAPAGGEPKESAAFRQLKESLNKPPSQTAASVLGNALGPAKPNLPQHTGQ